MLQYLFLTPLVSVSSLIIGYNLLIFVSMKTFQSFTS
jgi:hypothetical protein